MAAATIRGPILIIRGGALMRKRMLWAVVIDESHDVVRFAEHRQEDA